MMAGKRYTESYRYGRVRLRKRAASGTWYLRFRALSTGRWVERSTGTTYKKEAERAADRVSAQLHNHEFDGPDGSIPLCTLFSRYFAE